MFRYFKISLILKLINLKEPILNSKVYITYYPSSLLLNGTTFPITTYLLYRLLSNTIQQELDQYISPLILETTSTKKEKGGEEGEEEKEEGKKGGTEEEERVEGEERVKKEERVEGEEKVEKKERVEGEERVKGEEGWEEEQKLGQEATTVKDLLPNRLGEFLNNSPLL